MAWLKPVLDQWLASGRNYVLCGDWNIVRSALDIRNWKSNQKNSGCLPAERDWLNGLCRDGCGGEQPGWVDAYRALHPEGQDDTWWSTRGAARANGAPRGGLGGPIAHRAFDSGWPVGKGACTVAAGVFAARDAAGES